MKLVINYLIPPHFNDLKGELDKIQNEITPVDISEGNTKMNFK